MAKITAMSSLAYSHYTLYQALPRIAARGFTRVEIASFSSYCFHFNFGSPTPDELKQMLKDHSLTPIALNWSPDAALAYDESTHGPWIAAFERKIAQAAEVGIPMMTMHFGSRNDRSDQEEQLATAVRVFDQIGEFASQFGVKMLLEVPHLYTINWTPESVYWVFDRLSSSNVGALVDSSHWGIIGYDIDEFLGKLGARLWHIHLRDSQGPDTADAKQDLELTPGTGIVDFKALAKALDGIDYKGDVTTELEYRDITLEEIEMQHDIGFSHLAQCGWKFPESVKY